MHSHTDGTWRTKRTEMSCSISTTSRAAVRLSSAPVGIVFEKIDIIVWFLALSRVARDTQHW